MRSQNSPAIDLSQKHLNSQLRLFREQELGRSLDDGEFDKFNDLCFGYAVAASYMATTNAWEWWRNALIAISQWDGLSHSLEEEILLSNSQSNKLKTLFQYALHFILFNYGSAKKSGIPELSIFDFLAPGGLFVSEKGEIRHKGVAAGYLTQKELQLLLDEELFSQEGIFLIHGEYLPNTHPLWARHACSIWYKDNKWFFYDPDFGVKDYKEKTALIEEIIGVLGNSLIIQVASWDDKIQKNLSLFLERYAAIKNNPEILHELGLHVITKFSPQALESIVLKAFYESQFRNALILGLQTKDSCDKNLGYDIILNFHPQLIISLIHLSAISVRFKGKLVEYLTRDNAFGFMPTKKLVYDSPNVIEQIINAADNETFFNFLCIFLLFEKESGAPLGIHYLLEHHPKLFPRIVERMQTNENLRKKIFGVLTCCDVYGISVLNLIAQSNKTCLLDLVQFVKDDSELIPFFYDALQTREYINGTGFCLITKSSPEATLEVLQLACQNERIRLAVLQACCVNDCDDSKPPEIICRDGTQQAKAKLKEIFKMPWPDGLSEKEREDLPLLLGFLEAQTSETHFASAENEEMSESSRIAALSARLFPHFWSYQPKENSDVEQQNLLVTDLTINGRNS